jgi:hypothetical protein
MGKDTLKSGDGPGVLTSPHLTSPHLPIHVSAGDSGLLIEALLKCSPGIQKDALCRNCVRAPLGAFWATAPVAEPYIIAGMACFCRCCMKHATVTPSLTLPTPTHTQAHDMRDSQAAVEVSLSVGIHV